MTNGNGSSIFQPVDRIGEGDEKEGLRMEEASGLPPSHDLVSPRAEESSSIVCPVCGTQAVQEKCKVVCRSETCRGRIIMNCAEF
jgi:hypothetical protein